MPSPHDASPPIDSATSRVICRAVGEKLRQSSTEPDELPARLSQLLTELRLRDFGNRS